MEKWIVIEMNKEERRVYAIEAHSKKSIEDQFTNYYTRRKDFTPSFITSLKFYDDRDDGSISIESIEAFTDAYEGQYDIVLPEYNPIASKKWIMVEMNDGAGVQYIMVADDMKDIENQFTDYYKENGFCQNPHNTLQFESGAGVNVELESARPIPEEDYRILKKYLPTF